jgi:hypothetical protein
VAELELFRRTWGYFDGSDNYAPPDTGEQPDANDPPSLINSDVLRRIPLGDIVTRAQRWLADDSWRTDGIRTLPGPDLQPDDLTPLQRRALENSTTIAPRRRGRPELSDELLIEVAETYIREAGRGRGAINRMAEIFDRPEATIRDWISIARQRSYLAPTKAGRRGAAPGPQLPARSMTAETDGPQGTFSPNLTRERRRHLIRMIEGEGLLDAELPEDARLLYIVGGLVCNDIGVARQSDLQAGLADPDVMDAALEILAKARQRADQRRRTRHSNTKRSSPNSRRRTPR